MFLRGVISFAVGEEGRGSARGPARGKVRDDDSGAHCGVRRILGSKSDYQLVSEARLRCSLAFRATFYFRWRDNDPDLRAHTAPEGPAAFTPKTHRSQNNSAQQGCDDTAAQFVLRVL